MPPEPPDTLLTQWKACKQAYLSQTDWAGSIGRQRSLVVLHSSRSGCVAGAWVKGDEHVCFYFRLCLRLLLTTLTVFCQKYLICDSRRQYSVIVYLTKAVNHQIDHIQRPHLVLLCQLVLSPDSPSSLESESERASEFLWQINSTRQVSILNKETNSNQQSRVRSSHIPNQLCKTLSPSLPPNPFKVSPHNLPIIYLSYAGTPGSTRSQSRRTQALGPGPSSK